MRGTAWLQLKNGDSSRITPACAGNRIYRYCKGAYRKDHPRVCGEQVRLRRKGGGGKGSPPRVRGTVASRGRRRLWSRITPACAGNSPAPFPMRPTSGDHPRVCGEQSTDIFANNSNKGSPPRVRGTANSVLLTCLPYRITPACAGNRRDPGAGGHEP